MAESRGRAGDGDAPAGSPRAGRCVVLAAADAPTQKLLGALARRGLTVVLVTDPPRAMVELVRHGALALIIVEPDHMPGVGDLIEAVRACQPTIVCWQFTQRRLAPLNGRFTPPTPSTESPATPDLSASEGPVPVPAPNHPPRRNAHASPNPDLRGLRSGMRKSGMEGARERLGDLVVQMDGPGASLDDPPEPLVSEDELAMLLGPAGPMEDERTPES